MSGCLTSTLLKGLSIDGDFLSGLNTRQNRRVTTPRPASEGVLYTVSFPLVRGVPLPLPA
jgi:hypothetical protein